MIREHNTRSKYNIHTQFCNTSLFQKRVLNMGAKLYKYLPSKIKKLDNFNHFKKEVQLALLNNSFYHLKSFYRPSQCSNAVKSCMHVVISVFPFFISPKLQRIRLDVNIYIYIYIKCNTVIISYITILNYALILSILLFHLCLCCKILLTVLCCIYSYVMLDVSRVTCVSGWIKNKNEMKLN